MLNRGWVILLSQTSGVEPAVMNQLERTGAIHTLGKDVIFPAGEVIFRSTEGALAAYQEYPC